MRIQVNDLIDTPPILREAGLSLALEALAKNLLGSHAIRLDFRTDDQDESSKMDDAVSVILYRMTRELLVNVLKYANPHT